MTIGRYLALGCSSLLVLISANMAPAQQQAAPIPAEAAVKEDAVKPLTVKYYNFEKRHPCGTAGIDSMDIAIADVNQNSEDARVELPEGVIKFPPDVRTMVVAGKETGDFLFGTIEMEKRRLAEKEDGGPNVPADLKVATRTRNIWVFRGYIKVEKEGTYEFRTPCDDAARLSIGGVQVGSTPEGGMYGAMADGYLSRAEFVAAGIYPVEVLFYDKAGGSGIQVYSDVIPKGPSVNVGDGKELNLLQFLGGEARKTTLQGLIDDKKMKSELPVKTEAAVENYPIRTWKSTQGRTLEARFVSQTDTEVVLENTEGKKVKTQIQQLSEDDQKYLKNPTK